MQRTFGEKSFKSSFWILKFYWKLQSLQELQEPQHYIQNSFRSSSITLKNFYIKIFKYKEYSNNIHLNHYLSLRFLLELSSKTFRDLKDFNSSKLNQIQASKVLKNFHHKSSKTKKIRKMFEKHKEFLISVHLEIHCNIL